MLPSKTKQWCLLKTDPFEPCVFKFTVNIRANYFGFKELGTSLKVWRCMCTLIVNKGHGQSETDCTVVYSLTQQLRVTLHAPTG